MNLVTKINLMIFPLKCEFYILIVPIILSHTCIYSVFITIRSISLIHLKKIYAINGF